LAAAAAAAPLAGLTSRGAYAESGPAAALLEEEEVGEIG